MPNAVKRSSSKLLFATCGAVLMSAMPQPAVAGQATSAQQGEIPAEIRLKLERQMIQPNRRVVQFKEFKAPVDRAVLMSLIGRLNAISLQYKSTGKPRYWYSAFCGNMTQRMNVTVEFPNVVEMAETWERIQAGPEIHQWETDARAAGLVLESEMMLDQIDGPPLSNATYGPNDPPRVMQFLEFDTDNDAGGIIKAGEVLKELSDSLKVDRQQRIFQMDFVGQRKRINEVLVEYASFAAMQRGNILIDNNELFWRMIVTPPAEGKHGRADRLSECVMSELR